MAALNTNVINFADEYRGTVIGLLNAFFAGSPAAFAVIYYNAFADGANSDESEQDYPGFMLMISIVFAVVNILCIIFLKKYTISTSEQYEIFKESLGVPMSTQEAVKVSQHGAPYTSYTCDSNVASNTDAETSSIQKYRIDGNDVSHEVDDTVPFVQLIKDVEFHLLTWSFALATTSGLVIGNNITTTTKSLHNSSCDEYVVLIIPLTNLVVSFAMGILSDKIKSRIPRSYFLIACTVCFLISTILLTAFVDIFPVFVIATIFCGMAIGIAWSIVPTYLSELYGVKTFGRNWGILLIIASLLGFAGQAVFGAIYDSNIHVAGDVTCYGVKCVQGGYGTILATNAVALALIIIFTVKRRRQNSDVIQRLH